MKNIIVNNCSNPQYEAIFNDFLSEVFGISFAPWFERKLWDRRYESYSIIKEEKMLANVCIFKTELLIRGRRVLANQFCAVGTRKCARGKGFSRLLMEHVLALYPNTPAYLFANSKVLDFYPRFGFQPIQTYRPVISVKINNDQAKAVKISVEAAASSLGSRGAYSDTIDCLNTIPVQIFHLLMNYSDDIYRLPVRDIIVVAKQKGAKLFIADIILKEPVPFEQIGEHLPFADIDTVEFGFTPDWLNVTPYWESVDINSVPFFVKSNLDIPIIFRFPAMSET